MKFAKFKGEGKAFALKHAKWSNAGHTPAAFAPDVGDTFDVMVVERDPATKHLTPKQKENKVRARGAPRAAPIQARHLRTRKVSSPDTPPMADAALMELTRSTIILRKDAKGRYTPLGCVLFGGDMEPELKAAAAHIPDIHDLMHDHMKFDRSRGEKMRMFGMRWPKQHNSTHSFRRFGHYRANSDADARELLVDTDFGVKALATVKAMLAAEAAISPVLAAKRAAAAAVTGGLPELIPGIPDSAGLAAHAFATTRGLANKPHVEDHLAPGAAEVILWNTDGLAGDAAANFAFFEANFAIRLQPGVPVLAIVSAHMVHGTVSSDADLYGMAVMGNKAWPEEALEQMHGAAALAQELPADEKWRVITTDFARL